MEEKEGIVCCPQRGFCSLFRGELRRYISPCLDAIKGLSGRISRSVGRALSTTAQNELEKICCKENMTIIRKSLCKSFSTCIVYYVCMFFPRFRSFQFQPHSMLSFPLLSSFIHQMAGEYELLLS